MTTSNILVARAIVVANLFFLTSAMCGSEAFGGESPCARCGHPAQCQRVCRCVTEMKKVEVICWGYEDVEFCVPGPSQECEQHCETVCQDCDADSKVESQPKAFVWTRWLPTWAESYTRRKLMKRTTTKEVPSVKWVYEEVCETCAKATPPANEEATVRVASHEATDEPASATLTSEPNKK